MGLFDKIVKIGILGVAESVVDTVRARSAKKAQGRLTKVQTKYEEAQIRKVEALEKLKELYDNGAITKREYIKKKKQLLK